MRYTLALTDDEFAAILPFLYVIKSIGEPVGYRWEHQGDSTWNYIEMSIRQGDILHDFAKRSPVLEQVLEGVHKRETTSAC